MNAEFGTQGPETRPWNTEIAARVPLLRLEAGGWDQSAVETWREALSSTLGPEVPHDLFALWLYPPRHGAVLLGPPELAQDELEVPAPAPEVAEGALSQVEQRVRSAGYGSAICVAIPHGGRHVGLVLVANLRHGEYGAPEAFFLRQVAVALGPIMARMSRQWVETNRGAAEDGRTPGRPPGADAHAREIYGLLDTVGAAMRDATTPRQFTQLLSSTLQHVLPHDALEILVPDQAAAQHYRLSGHVHGHLWSHSTLVVGPSEFDPGRLFDDGNHLLVLDAATDPRGPVWGFASEFAREDIRSVVAVRLVGVGEGMGTTLGYLLLGGVGPDLYREEDADLLGRIGGVIAPRIEGLVLAWELDVLQSHLAVLRSMPAHLGRIAEILATTAHLSVATRLFAEEAAAVLPFSQCEFAVRIGAADTVVVFEPGETRPVSEMPVVKYQGTELGRVLDGQLSHAFAEARERPGPLGQPASQPSAALVVPFRVAGRVFGTMTLLATGGETFTQADVTIAQQLADILAPHLEHLRRGLPPTRSSSQAWRRVSQP